MMRPVWRLEQCRLQEADTVRGGFMEYCIVRLCCTNYMHTHCLITPPTFRLLDRLHHIVYVCINSESIPNPPPYHPLFPVRWQAANWFWWWRRETWTLQLYWTRHGVRKVAPSHSSPFSTTGQGCCEQYNRFTSMVWGVGVLSFLSCNSSHVFLFFSRTFCFRKNGNMHRKLNYRFCHAILHMYFCFFFKALEKKWKYRKLNYRFRPPS